MLAWMMTDANRNSASVNPGRVILDSVETYSVHYSEEALLETVNTQLGWCDFYGDLKRARILRS